MLDSRLSGNDTLGLVSRGEPSFFIRLKCYPLVKISYSEKWGEKPEGASPALRKPTVGSLRAFTTGRLNTLAE